jgi:hypothetical protein
VRYNFLGLLHVFLIELEWNLRVAVGRVEVSIASFVVSRLYYRYILVVSISMNEERI